MHIWKAPLGEVRQVPSLRTDPCRITVARTGPVEEAVGRGLLGELKTGPGLGLGGLDTWAGVGVELCTVPSGITFCANCPMKLPGG